MLEAIGVSRVFDVSRPRLQRVLAREGAPRLARGRLPSSPSARKHLALVGEFAASAIPPCPALASGCSPRAAGNPLRGPGPVGGARPGRAAAADEHDLPGSVRLAQSALARARHRGRAAARLRPDPRHGGAQHPRGRAARPGRARAVGWRSLPARILRRAAPARLDRPRAGERTRVPGLRRADQRARRFRAGADPRT